MREGDGVLGLDATQLPKAAAYEGSRAQRTVVATSTQHRQVVPRARLCEDGAAYAGGGGSTTQLGEEELGQPLAATVAMDAQQAHLDGLEWRSLQQQRRGHGAYKSDEIGCARAAYCNAKVMCALRRLEHPG